MEDERHMRTGGTGSKADKIARLRKNDEVKRDIGNTPEGEMYGFIARGENAMALIQKDQATASSGDYRFVDGLGKG
jgi:hypothetical protein